MKTNLNGTKFQKYEKEMEPLAYILVSERCTSKPTVHSVDGFKSTDISGWVRGEVTWKVSDKACK